MTGESFSPGVTHSSDTGAAYRHVAVFAPTHCLYQKEATVLESPKM